MKKPPVEQKKQNNQKAAKKNRPIQKQPTLPDRSDDQKIHAKQADQ
jgi:hypothetical protein